MNSDTHQHMPYIIDSVDRNESYVLITEFFQGSITPHNIGSLCLSAAAIKSYTALEDFGYENITHNLPDPISEVHVVRYGSRQ